MGPGTVALQPGPSRHHGTDPGVLRARVCRALRWALDEGVLEPAEVLALVASSTRGGAAVRLRLRVLGRFAVERDGRSVPDAAWERPLAARVVRFLLVHDGAAVPEDAIFEAFWPDMPVASARQNLRIAARRARDVLGAEAIERCGRTWRLALDDDVIVDAAAFDAQAVEALAATGGGRRAALERAAAAWTGEPLPEERYADWAAVWRERLRDRYAEVLGALARTCTAEGDHAGMLRAARASVVLEPCNEAAQRDLMVAYARAGLRGHALRQFRECRRVLVDELGVEPDCATALLHRRVLAGDRV